MARIAVLEDDPAQADLLASWLHDAGHAVVCFAAGRSVMQNAARESYDLFLLDWRTPGGTGEDVVKWLRQHVSRTVPVICATAMDDERNIVHALDLGADDYLVKPLRREETLARVRTLLRRAAPRDDDAPIVAGAYVVDRRQREVRLHGKRVELTPREYGLALMLFQNIGRILSRGHMLQVVWGQHEDIYTRRVDTHVSQIRQKLKLNAANGMKLVAVYQHGYRLEAAEPDAGEANRA
jgi:two-component system, OmpR family, response regulator RegX3